MLQKQQRDIQDYRHELTASEVENRILRKNMDRLKDDANHSRYVDHKETTDCTVVAVFFSVLSVRGAV